MDPTAPNGFQTDGNYQMKPALPRFLPFAIFMAFIGLDELLQELIGLGFIKLEATALYYLYPLKTVVVGYLLYRFREEYN